MSPNDVGKVCAIVKALGGPQVSPGEIEWAYETPSGKSLIKWLADQLPDAADGDEPSILNSLRQITLEPEESQLYEAALKGTDNRGGVVELTPYVVPSVQRTRNTFATQEHELLQAEVARLRARLGHMKTASQDLQKTKKQLLAAIQEADASIHQQNEAIAQVSIQVDNSLSRSVSEGEILIRSTGDSATSIQEYQGELAALASVYTNISSRFAERTQHIDDAQRSLPNQAHVVAEATRLSQGITELISDPEELLKNETERQLLFLCSKLEGFDEPRAQDLDRLLSEVGLRYDGAGETGRICIPDVRGEVEAAWRCDQFSILTEKERMLGEAQQALDKYMLPRLEQLQGELSSASSRNLTTETLVNALLEEIEDAMGDVESANQVAQPIQRPTTPFPPKIRLMEEMRSVLKELKDYRPPDGPPLVLLDNSDIEDELKSISRRVQEAQKLEESWLDDLPLHIPDVHRPLLAAIYANSPVNTSPPFAASPSLANLEAVARQRAEDMTRSIITIQKDGEMSDRAKRKIKNFVEARGS